MSTATFGTNAVDWEDRSQSGAAAKADIRFSALAIRAAGSEQFQTPWISMLDPSGMAVTDERRQEIWARIFFVCEFDGTGTVKVVGGWQSFDADPVNVTRSTNRFEGRLDTSAE